MTTHMKTYRKHHDVQQTDVVQVDDERQCEDSDFENDSNQEDDKEGSESNEGKDGKLLIQDTTVDKRNRDKLSNTGDRVKNIG